jgi:glutamate 5-kinase
MLLWDSLFAHLNQPVAQILLTRNDIADRTQYINAQNTLSELLSMGVIPIVNENDTLAVAEIKFGDNDTLSAITAAMVNADYLFLMTDVDCLYDKNPRTHPDASPLPVISDISTLSADVSTSGSSLGTGGMSTKIVAARLATSAGVTTIITRSSRPGNISEIVRYTESINPKISAQHLDRQSSIPPDSQPPYPLHTRFIPSANPIRSRHFWLLHSIVPHGTLYIDAGALTALSNGAGLLPAGVLALDGTFSQQEAVRLVLIPHRNAPYINHHHSSSSSRALSLDGDPTHHPLTSSSALHAAGEEVGRAIVNYASTEIARIRGVRSSQIGAILGYADSEYVCLRENIGLLDQEGKSRPRTPGLDTGGKRSADGGGTPAAERAD